MQALEERVRAVARRLESERSTRNYAQMERDKVEELYSAAKQQAEVLRRECIMMDNRVEQLERRHQADIKVYGQKIKSMRYEHTLNEKEVAQWSENILEQEVLMHKDRSQGNKADQMHSKRVVLDNTMREERVVMKLRKQNSSELAIMKREYFDRLKRMEAEYQTQERKAVELLELRRRAEIMQMEQEKNKHINTIIRNHEEAFEKTRQYHNEVLANNLEIVAQFETELHEMRQRNSEKNDMILEIGKENLKLKPPLQRAMEEKTVLLDCLKNVEKNKESMSRVQKALAKTERSISEIQEEMERLHEKVEKVLVEKAEVEQRMFDVGMESSNGISQKNALLERRVEELKKEVISKEAQIEEIVRQFRVQPDVLQAVGLRMDQELDTRDQIVKNLTNEISKVKKARLDAIRVFRHRLLEEGVPEEDLPAEDRDVHRNPQPDEEMGLLSGPAGLVVG